MLTILKNFFAASEGSIKGFLNAEELFRSILTAMGSGTTVGLLIMILQTIMSNIAVIFPNPTVATLATGLLTLVLDLLRRQNQGNTPAPAPAPQPTPAVN